MTEVVTIRGAFKGYKKGQVFEFTNGRVWEQTEYRYQYQYQYRPEAYLDASGNRGRIRVEGMDDWVDVRKIK